MKVTKDNVPLILSKIKIDDWLIYALLDDIAELNQLLDDRGRSYQYIFIDWRDYHDEYSPERTDPCPDYYGMFSLRFCNNPYEIIGDYMTIDELNSSICLLINFIEGEIS